MNIRLLIVDDHAVLRAGLRMLLDVQPDMTVVAEADTGEDAVAQARQQRPDVILLDLSMPGMGGLEAIRRLREVDPSMRILVLTMHDDEGYLRRALEAGSAGYVLKRAADAELVSAIRAVAGGGTYLHREHVAVLLQGTGETGEDVVDAQREVYEALSARERQVLQLVALGHTNQQVADSLCLSIKTVETYRGRLMRKLGLATRAALVRYALDQGLLADPIPDK